MKISNKSFNLSSYFNISLKPPIRLRKQMNMYESSDAKSNSCKCVTERRKTNKRIDFRGVPISSRRIVGCNVYITSWAIAPMNGQAYTFMSPAFGVRRTLRIS